MLLSGLKIFVSSVQKEFKQVRLDLKAFLTGDPVLRRFISEVFLFEQIPAQDRSSDEVYLKEVERCDIYLGIFGYDYGFEDQDGVPPTEREFDHATLLGKTRLIYVWGSDDGNRSTKMNALVQRVGTELVRRRVENISALTTEVYTSLVDYLDREGALRIPPFDAAICNGSSTDNLSRERIDWFLDKAQRERGFPLKSSTSTKALLVHLNLLNNSIPTNSAVLLFGKDPQRFHVTAITKCVHCHGTVYQRPFASLQTYGHDLFDQADQALDFVLSKIQRIVGLRDGGLTAPSDYELPPEAISEAIVNAVAHRDYYSNASVEIRLFSDRLEIWNPGRLPIGLTLESLRDDHPSVPNNPMLAESLYLARYIEKAGSGTQAMIERCLKAGLPEPLFEQRQGSFVVTLWRGWLSDRLINRFKLNERQMKAIDFLRSHERITNTQYQEITGTKRKTASRDLEDMVTQGIFKRVGEKRGSYYVFNRSI